MDCGYAEHAEALQFDHVRGEKLHNVSQIAAFSEARLWAEVAKCEVRCANCHAVKTAKEK